MRKLKDKLLNNLFKIFSLLYYFYCKTLRIRIFGNKDYLPYNIKKGGNNCIFCFWHSQIFPLIFSHRNKGIAVLVSRHRDGELIAKILRSFKFNLARGSFKRKGEIGFLSLRRFLKKGFCVAITPDGPRGPRWLFKEGAIILSRETKKPLILVGTGYSRFIEFKSWDRFRLPLPFSRVAIYISKLYYPGGENFVEFISEELTRYTSLAFELSRNPEKITRG